MFSFITPVLSFLFESLFNPHTYVGVFLGAVFAPVWVNIWKYLAALLVKKVPDAAPVVAEVTTVATDVVDVITPVANVVNADVTPASGTSTTK